MKLANLMSPLLKKKSRLFNYPRVFNQGEAIRLLNSFSPDEQHYKLALLLEASIGLRISDILRIKIYQFRENYTKILIEEKKTGRVYIRQIPLSVAEFISDYVVHNANCILREGYLFAYTGLNFYRHKNKHIQTSTVRLKIIEKVKELGIDDVFYIDEKGTKYHRIGSHSFRRLFCTLVQSITHDPAETQKIIRHIRLDTTLKYISYVSEKREKEVVNEVFNRHFSMKMPKIRKDQTIINQYGVE